MPENRNQCMSDGLKIHKIHSTMLVNDFIEKNFDQKIFRVQRVRVRIPGLNSLRTQRRSRSLVFLGMILMGAFQGGVR